MNERIGELLNELMQEITAIWGDKARFRASCHPDGYQSITIEEWEPDLELPIEAWKRRELYESWRCNDDWRPDRSTEQNAYYREHKCLLEEKEAV